MLISAALILMILSTLVGCLFPSFLPQSGIESALMKPALWIFFLFVDLDSDAGETGNRRLTRLNTRTPEA